MVETLHREWVYLWYYFTVQLDQIAGYWVLGILLGSVISVFGKKKIHTLFAGMQGKCLGIFEIVFASLLGVASPLCMYGTIPIAASFSEKGIRDDWLVAFMMSSILLNPQLLLYSAALGRTAFVIRVVSCVACGIIAGLLVRFLYRNRSFFNFSGFAEPASRDTDPNMLLRLLKNIGRNIKATGILLFDWHHSLGTVSALCASKCVCKPFRYSSRGWRADGGNDRGASLRLWRRNDPYSDGMAAIRNEHGVRSGVYDYRTCNKNHQPWGG